MLTHKITVKLFVKQTSMAYQSLSIISLIEILCSNLGVNLIVEVQIEKVTVGRIIPQNEPRCPWHNY